MTPEEQAGYIPEYESRREPIDCPNCCTLMLEGGKCPECDHVGDGSCTCDHCLMAESEDEE